MKPLFITLFTFLIILNVSYSQAIAADINIATDYELPKYSKIYDDKRNPFKDAVAAITLAKKTQRNVLIEIGGNWCTWCKRMDSFLEKNPHIYQSLHNKYVVLKVSVSDSNENEDFMKSLPPVLGYPHMYISENTGKMLLSKDTAELQENGSYSVNNWITFLEKWQNSSPKKANENNNVSE